MININSREDLFSFKKLPSLWFVLYKDSGDIQNTTGISIVTKNLLLAEDNPITSLFIINNESDITYLNNNNVSIFVDKLFEDFIEGDLNFLYSILKVYILDILRSFGYKKETITNIPLDIQSKVKEMIISDMLFKNNNPFNSIWIILPELCYWLEDSFNIKMIYDRNNDFGFIINNNICEKQYLY